MKLSARRSAWYSLTGRIALQAAPPRISLSLQGIDKYYSHFLLVFGILRHVSMIYSFLGLPAGRHATILQTGKAKQRRNATQETRHHPKYDKESPHVLHSTANPANISALNHQLLAGKWFDFSQWSILLHKPSCELMCVSAEWGIHCSSTCL